LVGDLSSGEGLPAEAFDCIILTQTLHVVFDVRPAVRQVYRMLKPGGVLLATVPGISQISRYDMDRWGDFWRLTTLSARRLFEEVGAETVDVEANGNVLAAIAFLHGLATEELRRDELDACDPDYELLISVRVVKAHTGAPC
jgi:SAM-dependent methyltransferase